ncbi:MAG: hypothetical protein RBU27_02600 [Bacteroidota bacterium]|jgi:hypothetical protein|nr:hypothetical protein [Bacteroidota bacterium]
MIERSTLTTVLVRALVLVIIAMASATPTLIAQRIPSAHGFQQTYPGAIAIGLSAGPNFNVGMSGPRATCDCEFDGGTGIGSHAGLHLDVHLNRWFGLRLQGLYEDYSSVYESDFAVAVFDETGATADATARRRADVSLHYVGISFQSVWFTGPAGMYLLAGAGVGFFAGGTLRDEEFITTPGFVYPSTGTSTQLYEDGDLDQGRDPVRRASLIVGVGYSVPLARGIAIAPELQFDYPLTSVIEGNADWSIPTIRTSVGLRFGL